MDGSGAGTQVRLRHLTEERTKRLLQGGLGAIDILDWMILCSGDHPARYRMLSNVLGYYP